MRLLLTGSMDNGKIVSRKCQAGKNPQEPDAKLAQLACHNQNSFFLPAMGYGIRNSHPPNPIKLDVFRFVPCYLHLMINTTC